MTAPSSLELGAIGNGTLAALIDQHARVVWCCFPRFDADPAFCALLGPREVRGDFAIDVEGAVATRQTYVGNSAVLSTEVDDASGGRVEIVDFAPRYRQYDRMFHPPMLVRRVSPVAGNPAVRIRIEPARDYGKTACQRSFGSNHVRFLTADAVLRVTTDAPVGALSSGHVVVLDRPLHFVLGPDETLARGIGEFCRDALDRTLDYWRDWTRALYVPVEWQDAVIRAAITLKLCQFEDTGAIVAALTTSIPEAPGTARNWDYRYCWLRDAAFVVRALNQLSATRSMEHYLRYVLNLTRQNGHLQPVYGIGFEHRLDEREATALAGYAGHAPVRVGNDAYRQLQHDVHGSLVLALEQLFFDRRLDRIDLASLYTELCRHGEAAAAAFGQPDAGIWEFRGRHAPHTYSALICWAAVDRLGRIARRIGATDEETWRTRAEAMRATLLERAWDPTRRCFVDAFEDGRVDASVLALSELGAIAPDDPRMLSTLDRIAADLGRGDHILRYADADDFGRPATAFTLCTFWYVMALHRAGRRDEARALFERVLACRTRLGLLSEDIDPVDGRAWGNFPQTYPLVGLIRCAMMLSRRWEDFL
jgi:GH15 family glucan-1,4-alpha-glucosidase